MKPSTEYEPRHRARRGTASRQWFVVSSSGEHYLEDGKQSIMKRTGLPSRDLRVLDPLLSYPSTILGRERAIVVSLEHIKAIITAAEVLIPNSKDPVVGPFLHDLRARVSSSNLAHPQAMESVDSEALAKAPSCWPLFPGHHHVVRLGTGIPRPLSTWATTSSSEMLERSHDSTSNSRKVGGTKVLPFEFRALEVCLESVCRCLESETLTLEREAYPALDELTSKLNTLKLERVRQLKNRLVAISGRVQKVRDELEHLLDDDMDMAEMYLSEKLACQPVGESSARGDNDTDELEQDDDREEDIRSEPESSHGSLGGSKPNVQELEMLLEAYFVQIDGTLNKLSHLREYVDDTEDYINIMLDQKQNKLLQMGVMLSTATVMLTAGVVVVSIFGMNIGISLFEGAASPKFSETTFGTIAGIVGFYAIAIGWGKKAGYLQ